MTVTAARAGDDRAKLPDPADKPAVVESMFDRIAGRYDLMNRLLTLGLDVRWRRRAVESLNLGRAATVLDVACGTGDFCRDLTHAGYRTIGVDFSAGMLSAARTSAALVRGDALGLPFASGRADGITCGFALRNFADLEPFFQECARLLRTGGRIAFLEVAEPEHRLLRAGHDLYFRRIVPVVGGILSDRRAYRYLPESTAYLPPPADLIAQIEAAGFAKVDRTLLAPGAAQLLTGTRR